MSERPHRLPVESLKHATDAVLAEMSPEERAAALMAMSPEERLATLMAMSTQMISSSPLILTRMATSTRMISSRLRMSIATVRLMSQTVLF